MYVVSCCVRLQLGIIMLTCYQDTKVVVNGPLLCIATAAHYCDVMSHLLCLLLQFVGEPVGYVQQIVVKSTVAPWDSQRLIQTDAFRAPLATAFSLLEHINSFKLVRGYAVGHCC